MGLIKAAINAVAGNLADQYKDTYTASLFLMMFLRRRVISASVPAAQTRATTML